MGQRAEAGTGEHHFDQHRARQQAAHADPEHGDNRHHGDGQHVAERDPEVRHAESAIGADVVLAQRFEHGGADEARSVADPADAYREGGQEEPPRLVAIIARLAGADGGQPTQDHRERDERVDGDEEGGQRDDAGGKDAD